MSHDSKALLTDAEQAKIVQAVKDAEGQTSGEIVVMVVPQSYHYPTAQIWAATTLALPLAVLTTGWLGGLLWAGGQNMWVFLAAFIPLFLVVRPLVARWPWFKRLFISRAEILEEVEEAAITAFYRQKLHATRESNGILLFVSLLEHRVWVLADEGIHAKVPADTWTSAAGHIAAGIKSDRAADAICESVGEVGQLLKAHFPIREDDRDELRNLIVQI